MRGIMYILWNIKSPKIQTVTAEFNDSSDSETDIKTMSLALNLMFKNRFFTCLLNFEPLGFVFSSCTVIKKVRRIL